MHSKPILARLLLFAAACILSSALCPFVNCQQSPPPPPMTPAQAQAVAGSFRRFETDPFRAENLNEESKASDSAGIHLYAEHLVESLVPGRAGAKYIRSLTDRLARAEELARAGKGSLVPEAKVAEAYNELIKQIGAPASLYSDEQVVRRHRHIAWVPDPSPTFYSSKRNAGNCYPGEAVFLLTMLIGNNGGPREDPAPGPAAQAGRTPPSARWVSGQAISGPQAGMLLSSYYAVHSRHANEALFNEVARTLSF